MRFERFYFTTYIYFIFFFLLLNLKYTLHIRRWCWLCSCRLENCQKKTSRATLNEMKNKTNSNWLGDTQHKCTEIIFLSIQHFVYIISNIIYMSIYVDNYQKFYQNIFFFTFYTNKNVFLIFSLKLSFIEINKQLSLLSWGGIKISAGWCRWYFPILFLWFWI